MGILDRAVSVFRTTPAPAPAGPPGLSRAEVEQRLGAGPDRSLAGLNLAGADLSEMDLEAVDLSNAKLRGAA